jgi:nucleoside-diphosphate-sugar epimerase
MTILVTGGAGYIGSVRVEVLREQGEPVIVLDNLLRGHRAAVTAGVPFYQGANGAEVYSSLSSSAQALRSRAGLKSWHSLPPCDLRRPRNTGSVSARRNSRCSSRVSPTGK